MKTKTKSDIKTIGIITVENIIENSDGTATITFEISEDVKENLKKSLKWKRWSQKRFETYINKALLDYVKELEAKHGIRQP